MTEKGAAVRLSHLMLHALVVGLARELLLKGLQDGELLPPGTTWQAGGLVTVVVLHHDVCLQLVIAVQAQDIHAHRVADGDHLLLATLRGAPRKLKARKKKQPFGGL